MRKLYISSKYYFVTKKIIFIYQKSLKKIEKLRFANQKHMDILYSLSLIYVPL